MDHPSIVKLMDVIIPTRKELTDFNEVYMVMEFCESDLKKLLKGSLKLE